MNLQLLLQGVLSGQLLIGVVDDGRDGGGHGGHGDQTGEKAGTHAALGDKGADLIDQEATM